MNFIAPNLSAIIGTGVAAKMMGAAGGLTNLSKMRMQHTSKSSPVEFAWGSANLSLL
jgi:hexokinase